MDKKEFWRKWAEKCTDHCRAMGYTNSRGEISAPVINKYEHPNEWQLWRQYYEFRDMVPSVEIMDVKNEKTVPEISPINFDAEFVPTNGV